MPFAFPIRRHEIAAAMIESVGVLLCFGGQKLETDQSIYFPDFPFAVL